MTKDNQVNIIDKLRKEISSNLKDDVSERDSLVPKEDNLFTRPILKELLSKYENDPEKKNLLENKFIKIISAKRSLKDLILKLPSNSEFEPDLDFIVQMKIAKLRLEKKGIENFKKIRFRFNDDKDKIWSYLEKTQDFSVDNPILIEFNKFLIDSKIKDENKKET